MRPPPWPSRATLTALTLAAIVYCGVALTFIDNQTVLVNTGSDLLQALRNESISVAVLNQDIELNATEWGFRQVILERKFTIVLQNKPARQITFDLGGINRGAITCNDHRCYLSVSGAGPDSLRFVNSGATYGGILPLVSPISIGLPRQQNGSVYLDGYTVEQKDPSEDFWFDPQGLLWKPDTGWYALGMPIRVECPREKEMLIRDWKLTSSERYKYAYYPDKPEVPFPSQGMTSANNILMRISDKYAWTEQDCLNQVEVCKRGGAPLKQASCIAPADPEEDGSLALALGVGLGVGLGLLLLAALAALLLVRRRRQRRQREQREQQQLHASDSSKQGWCKGGDGLESPLPGVGPGNSGAASATAAVAVVAGSNTATGVGTGFGKAHHASTGLLSSSSRMPPASTASGTTSRQGLLMSQVESLKQQMLQRQNSASEGKELDLQVLELLGEGTYGRVHKALWRGTVVAVKTMHLPANMTGAEKMERMAIMEAAISSSLNHPALVHTYTYIIRPLYNSQTESSPTNTKDGGLADIVVINTNDGTLGNGRGSQLIASDQKSGVVHSYEVQLVLEFCDRGCLRDALEGSAFALEDGCVNYAAVLDTALDIATAMLHMHEASVLHSDLKVRNVMLKSCMDSGRGVVAKVADFGLAMRLDHMETHRSGVFQGTLTHMGPEVLLAGRLSKASDVYAFGITCWELYTAGRAFKGVPKALLGHTITKGIRPEFPANTPPAFRTLVQRCWAQEPSDRPTFREVMLELRQLRDALGQPTAPLRFPPASVPASGSSFGKGQGNGNGNGHGNGNGNGNGHLAVQRLPEVGGSKAPAQGGPVVPNGNGHTHIALNLPTSAAVELQTQLLLHEERARKQQAEQEQRQQLQQALGDYMTFHASMPTGPGAAPAGAPAPAAPAAAVLPSAPPQA